MVTDLVEIIESRVVTTSTRVADYFGKEHKHVLDSIKALEKDMGVLGTEPKFRLSEYVDSTGRKLPMYLMDRDGFTLLAMGFTGKKALKFKLDYIAAFNAMEKALREGRKQSLHHNYEAAKLIFETAGLKTNQLTLALDKLYKAEAGVSALEQGGVILEAPVKQQLLTPTEIARELGWGNKPREVNVILAAMGLQRKCGKNKWEPLDTDLAVMQDTNKWHGGVPVTQLKWRSGVISEIKDFLSE